MAADVAKRATVGFWYCEINYVEGLQIDISINLKFHGKICNHLNSLQQIFEANFPDTFDKILCIRNPFHALSCKNELLFPKKGKLWSDKGLKIA